MSSKEATGLVTALDRAVRLFLAGSSLSEQKAAEELKLHPTDMQFLNLLDLLGPLTPGVLAQSSGLSSGGVTVVLDRLEQAGYIRRTKNPADRRSVLVELVGLRKKAVTAQPRFRQALDQLTPAELETVLKFFSAANVMRPAVPGGVTAATA